MPLSGAAPGDGVDAQLLLYARDLRRLLEIERGQRALLQSAYRETVLALASALESKDTGTRAHSQRVQRYAIELARVVDPALVEDAEHRVRLPAPRRRQDRRSPTGSCRSRAR